MVASASGTRRRSSVERRIPALSGPQSMLNSGAARGRSRTDAALWLLPAGQRNGECERSVAGPGLRHRRKLGAWR